jgi:hypothetical protein
MVDTNRGDGHSGCERKEHESRPRAEIKDGHKEYPKREAVCLVVCLCSRQQQPWTMESRVDEMGRSMLVKWSPLNHECLSARPVQPLRPNQCRYPPLELFWFDSSDSYRVTTVHVVNNNYVAIEHREMNSNNTVTY